MPLNRTKAARAQRRAAIRADRARGFTMRELARLHGVSVTLAHYLTHDVQVVLPNRWHQARQSKEAPLPPLSPVHRVMTTR